MSTEIDVRRADTRPHTRIGWLDSHHSFSFGHHYDPDEHPPRPAARQQRRPRRGRHRLQHPPAPGHGDRHVGARRRARAQGLRGQPRGALSRARPAHERGHRHLALRDEPHGRRRRALRPDVGAARHRADRARLRAARHQRRAATAAASRPIASGRGHDAAISLRQRDAVLWGGRLQPGETVAVPDARNVHLFVAAGDADLEGAGALATGDAVRLHRAGSPKLTAGRVRRRDAHLGHRVGGHARRALPTTRSRRRRRASGRSCSCWPG